MNKPNMEEKVRKVEKLARSMTLSCEGEENIHVVMACLSIVYRIMESSDTQFREVFTEMLYETANFPYKEIKRELH